VVWVLWWMVYCIVYYPAGGWSRGWRPPRSHR